MGGQGAGLKVTIFLCVKIIYVGVMGEQGNKRGSWGGTRSRGQNISIGAQRVTR